MIVPAELWKPTVLTVSTVMLPPIVFDGGGVTVCVYPSITLIVLPRVSFISESEGCGVPTVTIFPSACFSSG